MESYNRLKDNKELKKQYEKVFFYKQLRKKNINVKFVVRVNL